MLLKLLQKKSKYTEILVLISSTLSKKKIQIGSMNFMLAKYTECVKKLSDSEMDIVRWIFEHGELDFVPINQIDEFLKRQI